MRTYFFLADFSHPRQIATALPDDNQRFIAALDELRGRRRT